MPLRKLAVQNYRCFRDRQELEIFPVTVVLGKSNSGKGALVRAPLVFATGFGVSTAAPLDLGRLEAEPVDAFTDLIFEGSAHGNIKVEFDVDGDRPFRLAAMVQNVSETDGWDAMRTRAMRDWLLDRLEAPELWGDQPEPLSVAQLADRVRHDEDFRAVLDLWVGHDQHDPVKTLAGLVADEHVPFLSGYRYKPSGLRKRARWERTWALKREEDEGKVVTIDVPPKYASADFARPSYLRNRGKLDVPKERFISYPKLGRDGDPTDLLGWAGWDHLGQARALATVYLDRRQQAGWPAQRLLPLLAGLVELEPWLRQWHADPQPGYAGTPADFFTGLIDTGLATLGTDRATLATIRGVQDLP